MNILDKKNTFATAQPGSKLVLELGCGSNKKIPNALGIDRLNGTDVDLVGEVNQILLLLPPSSVSEVYAFHFIEHINDLEELLRNIERVTERGARVVFVAPHFSNPYYYSDPTHRLFFGLYTFCYYLKTGIFRRQVPTYENNFCFDLLNVNLTFKSTHPFYFRHFIKRLFGSIFDSCIYMRELYEENFCYIFPCYEVTYVLERR